ncbi:MAG TPA: hypothetical protein VHN19_05660 [Burkholderiales bacterium]|jgi:hypothetical protein|nr:hypothetical protein [Burkholderiales bacterium]
MRACLMFLAAFSSATFAQNAEIQKQLLLRDQQSAEFALQLRQSQEALKVAPADRANVESRQLRERQRLENLDQQQRANIRPDTPEALRPVERLQAEADRRPFLSPIVEVPVEPAPPPLKMEPSLKGNVDVIEAPR